MKNKWFYFRQFIFLLPVLFIIGAVLFGIYASRKFQTIHEAAKRGDLTQVQALIKARPELIYARYKECETPLYAAADTGQAEVVKFLITCGADVNTESYDGIRALHIAADHGHADVVKLLLARGAEVNVKNGFGLTPLDEAVRSEDQKTVELLLDYGADVNAGAKDPDATTPMALARETGNKDLEELLRTHGGHE